MEQSGAVIVSYLKRQDVHIQIHSKVNNLLYCNCVLLLCGK